MQPDNKNLWLKILPYAGTLPFIIAVILLLSGHRLIPPYTTVGYMAISYGLVISSFMSGSLWGIALRQPGYIPLLIISNVITLTAWLSFLTQSFAVTALITAILFLYLLALDYKLQILHFKDYLKTRRNVTAIVVGCLIIIAFQV